MYTCIRRKEIRENMHLNFFTTIVPLLSCRLIKFYTALNQAPCLNTHSKGSSHDGRITEKA